MSDFVNLFLVCHGKTISDHPCLGSSDGKETALSLEGKQQAELIANLFKRGVLSQFPTNKIYSSSQKRTLETAKEIEQSLFPSGKRSRVVREADLADRRWGMYEKAETFPWVDDKGTLYTAPEYVTKYKGWTPKNGESSYQLYERVVDIIKKIAQENIGKNVIVVTHPECMRVLAPDEAKEAIGPASIIHVFWKASHGDRSLDWTSVDFLKLTETGFEYQSK